MARSREKSKTAAKNAPPASRAGESTANGTDRPPTAKAPDSGHAAIVYLVALVAFVATIRFYFLYDDDWTIVENAFIKRLSNLFEFFTPAYFKNVPDNNRPVMIVTTMIDYQLHGLRPGGYHMQNVLWHCAASVAAWGLFRRLFGAGFLALFGALVFAVHPFHAEAVASINYREDLLGTFFALCSLLLLLKFRESGKKRHFAAGVALFILGIFSKESALAVPPLLVITDLVIAPHGKRWATAWRNKWQAITLGVIGLALFVPFYMAFKDGYTSVSDTPRLDLVTRLFTTFRINAAYLGQFIVPIGMSPEYEVVPSGLTDIRNWLGLGLCVGLIALAVRVVRKAPAVSWGIGWFFVGHLPTMNIMPIFNMRADRYMYFPSVGICLAMAAIAIALGGRVFGAGTSWKVRERRDLWPAVGLVFVLLPLCIWQSFVYSTPNRLWARSVEIAPSSRRAWEGAVLAFARGGEPERAMEYAAKALQRFPGNGKILMGRGIAHAELKDLDASIADFEVAAVRLHGAERGRLLNNLGVAYKRKEDYVKAEQQFRKALEIAPRSDMFRRHLADSLELQGRLSEALTEYRKVLEVAPRDTKSAEKVEELSRTRRGQP